MNNSPISNDDTLVHLIANDSSSAEEMGPPAKKRKLTMGEMSSNNIELELLQAANEKWKQYAKKLESEKHLDGCDQQKILELQDTISNLEEMNAELKAKNEQEKIQHKNEMESIINEYTTKIQILEGEKQECESKIKELADEIASMKNIKMEIKDSVENEREKYQAEKEALTAEISDVKEDNRFLSEANQNLLKLHESEIQSLKLEKEKAEAKMEEERKSFHSTISDSENQRKEIEKKLGETTVTNQQLEQKCKQLEALVNKSVTEYQSTIDGLKADNQNLSKVNSTLKNNEKALQNSVNEFKKKIEKMEKNEPEMKSVSLNEIFDGSKFKTSLLSCKSNIVVNVTKITGASSESWKLYSTTNETEMPHLLTHNDMINTCLKMNITDEIQASYGQNF